MKLKKGKSCSRSDMVVAEMLQEGPDEVFDIIAALFGLRLINHPTLAEDEVWDEFDIHLIEKV
eukprot:6708711-Pyramimonas_sp.AAC.1